MIINHDKRWDLMGVWEKGGEEIWFLFYWDSVIQISIYNSSYLKAKYV